MSVVERPVSLLLIVILSLNVVPFMISSFFLSFVNGFCLLMRCVEDFVFSDFDEIEWMSGNEEMLLSPRKC